MNDLETCLRVPPEQWQTMETLEVPYWNTFWWRLDRTSHTNALANICNRLHVKKLIFTAGPTCEGRRNPFSFFVLLKQHCAYPFPYLPHLMEIEVTTCAYETIFDLAIVKDSNAKKFTCNMPLRGNIRGRVYHNLFQFFASMSQNFRIRELCFNLEKKGPLRLDDLLSYAQSVNGAKVAGLLQRNRKAWAKCTAAISIFLGLMKRRKERRGLWGLLHGNLCGMISAMLRETRGTQVWAETTVVLK